MRVSEEIAKAGYFWLPNAENEKVYGTLKIEDGGKIFLELVEGFRQSLGRSLDDTTFDIIHGFVENFGYITLDHFFYKYKSISLGGLSKSIIIANRCLCGLCFNNYEYFFNEVKFSIEGLDEWIGLYGISADINSLPSQVSIEYKPPESLSFYLNDQYNFSVSFDWTFSGICREKEAKITQKAFFIIKSELPRHLDEFMNICHKITTLACFAFDGIVSIDSFKAKNYLRIDQRLSSDHPTETTIYYSSLPFNKYKLEVKWHQIIFRLPYNSCEMRNIIGGWLEAYEEISPALSLYFAVKEGSYRYSDGKFLALIQALETYHRRKSDDKMMSDEKFQAMQDAIFSVIPEEYKIFLHNKLKHANEVTLSRRIKSVIEPFKQHFGDNKSRKHFVRKVVDTRNYLTHYDKSIEKDAASGLEMVYLSVKMEAIMQIQFLKIIGFSAESINAFIEDSSTLKEKLSGAVESK